MKLFLVRHGETEYNAKGIIQGALDSPLTARGEQQAAALAECLKTEEFKHIFSSDLGRAYATAQIVGQYHSCEIQSSELLRERRFGKLEGSVCNLIGIITQQLRQPAHEFVPAEGESFDAVRERARRFIDRHLPLDSDESILVVAHGALNRCLLAELLDLNNRFMATIQQANCCLNIITLSQTSLQSLVINYTHHLPQL